MGPVLFGVLAVLLIISALGVIVLRHPVRSALSLVVTLFLLAVMFVLLDAQIVAALQVVVYAGAIMVLFLFVIMLLNLQSDAQSMARLAMRCAAVLVGSLFLLAGVRFFTVSRELGMSSPAPAGFGSTEELAKRLFTRYLFAFETTSVLLLVAIVGAVVLAKRKLV
jgi:NADH-quinone oxidoreductase subunit J